MKPTFRIDDNLRFVPNDFEALQNHIYQLKQEMQETTDKTKVVSLLGEVSVYLDRMNLFDEAEALILKALTAIEKYNLGLRKTVQQQIRLATVIQHKKNFAKSNAMFSEIIKTCSENEEARHYLDYALQHSGKNYFDQEDYNSALSEFEKAFAIRQKNKAQSEQLESTKVAIETTKKRLATQGSNLKLGGVYQHYKGQKYKVIDLVRHSESLEELVLYETLYENDLGKLWVRPKQMFLETVVVEGKSLPRFKLI